MRVIDRGRVWHGVCHLDGALQAPPDHDLTEIEGYRQGPTTDTSYPGGAHLPGLDQGGWHDAGDYDLAAGAQAWATLVLALARESFGLDTDQTAIDPVTRQVELHVPDGAPDVLQQVAHGVRNLLSGYRLAGHSFAGITDPTLEQYQQVGDASTMTDNRVFDPALGPDQVQVDRSGRRDDRVVFTNRDTALEYRVAAALAAASRVLAGFDDRLAGECRAVATKTWEHEQTLPAIRQPSAYVPERVDEQEVLAAVELLLATRDETYALRLRELLPVIEDRLAEVGWSAARALPLIEDQEFARRLEAAAARHAADLRLTLATNPFGVPFEPQIWVSPGTSRHTPSSSTSSIGRFPGISIARTSCASSTTSSVAIRLPAPRWFRVWVLIR